MRLLKGYSQTTVEPELGPGITIGSVILGQRDDKSLSKHTAQLILTRGADGPSSFHMYLTYHQYQDKINLDLTHLREVFPSQIIDPSEPYSDWTKVKRTGRDKQPIFIKRLTPEDAAFPGLAEAFITGLTGYMERDSETSTTQSELDEEFKQETEKLKRAREIITS